jgi:hypothetical protein
MAKLTIHRGEEALPFTEANHMHQPRVETPSPISSERRTRRFSSGSFLIGFGIGSFLGVAFALFAVVLVRENQPTAAGAVVAPTIALALTPTSTATPVLPRARTKGQLDVRLGPGPAFAIIGIMQRGEAVEIVGRDAAGGWVAVRFPPGSVAQGWVAVDQLEGVTGLDEMAVVLPTPLPRTVATPGIFRELDVTGNDGLNPPPVLGTAVLSGAAPLIQAPPPNRDLSVDLVVNRISRLPDGRVSVMVGNRGPGSLDGQITLVVVRDLAANSEQLFITQDLPVGAAVTIQTRALAFDRETEVQVLVDPGASTRDPDRSNNFLSAILSPPPAVTPTPRVGN